MTVSTCKATGS